MSPRDGPPLNWQGPTRSVVGKGYVLDVQADAVDAFRFERLASEGRDHLKSGAVIVAPPLRDPLQSGYRGS